jgi:hypothetical protein
MNRDVLNVLPHNYQVCVCKCGRGGGQIWPDRVLKRKSKRLVLIGETTRVNPQNPTESGGIERNRVESRGIDGIHWNPPNQAQQWTT